MRSLSVHALLTLLLSVASFLSIMGKDLPLDLGLATPYAILAGSTVTSTGTTGTVVTGNLGIFPGTARVGFPPAILNGVFDSGNGAAGNAQGALTTAYNAAAAKPFNTTLSDMDLGGMTLLPGVYKFDAAAAMNGALTLDADGDVDAIWTFQIGSALMIAEGSSIIFKDSIGNADYVYWQVGTTATIAINVPMVGNILALNAIIVNDGASVNGRCLARNAEVTLDKSVITIPSTPTEVSFSATQTINGISLTQYEANLDINAATLKEAIADSMTGVLPADIQNFAVTAGSTTPAASVRILSADSIILNYDVVVTSSMSAEELENELIAAENDGTFDTNLHTAASNNGATDLLTATTGTSAAEPTSQPSSQPTMNPTVTPPTPPVKDTPLDLGLAQPYAILAGTTVTSTGTIGTVVTGNIGIFPGSAITGFPPAIVNGAIDSANGASGGAQGSLTTAYNVLAGKAFNTTLSNQDLGGMTLLPGVYKFDAAAALNGILTLDADGDVDAIWTFQIGTSLLIAEGSSILFKDSIGNADYVYWQVGSTATLAIGVPMIGNILALNSIIVNIGATVHGRCLARNAEVTLDKSVITMPASVPSVVTVVSFSATQTVNGISLDTYNANPELNSATLKEAIADSMTAVQSSDIENFAVTAGSSSAANIQAVKSFRSSVVARALTTDSIILNYDVVVSSTMTSEQLQAQLTAAVENGVFNDNLHAAAANNGATDLDNATSDTITTEPIATDDTPTTDSSSSDKQTLSTGAIIGIVIGGFVALVLIALIIYYCACASPNVGATHKSTSVSRQEV